MFPSFVPASGHLQSSTSKLILATLQSLKHIVAKLELFIQDTLKVSERICSSDCNQCQTAHGFMCIISVPLDVFVVHLVFLHIAIETPLCNRLIVFNSL